ncbi:MAG: PIG-L family deacetylase [Pirellulaceae bacterium]
MPSVLAIAAHPDDIEFVMAGTMLLLQGRGWDLHYLNIADGSCGAMETGPTETAKIRLEEARHAAASLGATFYPPLCPDLEIRYDVSLLRKVAAVVRQAKPQIVLTHSPVDYMEDHQEACSLAVAASFTYSMPNFKTIPDTSIYAGPVTIYHAQPHGNRTPLGDPVEPHFAIDIQSVIERKMTALECHASQKDWLDVTQGMGSFVKTMCDLCNEVGRMTGRFAIAEGWRRHHHLGYCGPDDDPLADALQNEIHRLKPARKA